MSNPKLEFKDPVPSDIEISQAYTPLNITKVAENAGLLPSEGKYRIKQQRI